MIWNWKLSAFALASVIVLAVVLVKPIGVSTQYVIADGIVWRLFDSEVIHSEADPERGAVRYSSPNAYLNKGDGKYATAVAEPVNYGLVFVLSMALGALLASRLRRGATPVPDSDPTLSKVTNPDWRRYAAAFASGFLVLFGARLAGGCTSGHMLSGITQTAVSGYLFAAAVFATAIPTALMWYRTRTNYGEIQP